MRDFDSGTESVTARCLSAEVRARLAAQRVSQRELAERGGWASHNYVAMRLRDEKPFTIDDLERLAEFFEDGNGLDAVELLRLAIERQSGPIWDHLITQSRPARLAARLKAAESATPPNAPEPDWSQVPSPQRWEAVEAGQLDELTARRLDDEQGQWPDRQGLAAMTGKPGLRDTLKAIDEAGEESQDDGGVEPL